MHSSVQSGGCHAPYLLVAWLIFAGQLAFVSAEGATKCASGQLDWYTSVVGETPCRTYERLRQICNSDYQVPKFEFIPPGDKCDDQVSACCCNDVAFGLSMLCMNCQQDVKSGDQIGIDAPAGSYTQYRGACGAGTAKSLDAETQQAVCNQDIRLDDFLYGGWDDGAWFYVWTKEHAELTHAANNNNTFTHCPNQRSSSATLSPLVTSSSTGASSILLPQTSSQPVPTVPTPSESTMGGTTSDDHGSSGLSSGASTAIGVVVGLVGVGAIAVAGIFLWRRHKRVQHAYSCPSNAARRSYNIFADKPPGTTAVASPYLMPTDTSGQMDGDLKPNRFV